MSETPKQQVMNALLPGASFAQIESAANALTDLAKRAAKGDQAAFAETEWLLYDLSFSDDKTTEITRRWLAPHIYHVQEENIPPPENYKLMSEAEFIDRLECEIEGHSRVDHPASQHLFSGKATNEQYRIFVKHQWFRTHKLYLDAAELSMNFEKLDDAAFLYRYLYGETGGEDAAGAHSHLLGHLMKAMDLKPDFKARSTMLEEVVYLNNRARCFRHPNVAWGLAVFYVTELVVPKNHGKLYKAFRNAGFDDQATEYYKVHISLVPPRVKREWQLIADRLHDETFQRTFLTSLLNFLRIERRYYDAIWAEMQAA